MASPALHRPSAKLCENDAVHRGREWDVECAAVPSALPSTAPRSTPDWMYVVGLVVLVVMLVVVLLTLRGLTISLDLTESWRCNHLIDIVSQIAQPKGGRILRPVSARRDRWNFHGVARN
jgi:hypothetical protein